MYRSELLPSETALLPLLRSYASRPYAAEATFRRFQERRVDLGAVAADCVTQAFLKAGQAEKAKTWLADLEPLGVIILRVL